MRPDTILAFDTSAAHCAAALLSGASVWHRFEPMDKGQAERLIPMLTDLLADAGMDWKDLSRIAVGTGPGNSTGVRIAVAAARGLALGLAIPATGVTRLEAAAYGLPRPLVVVEDARRGEFYVQIFDPAAQPACLVTAQDLSGVVGSLPVAGTAASLLGRTALDQRTPIAEAIARIAAAQPPDHMARPAPFYLRNAVDLMPTDPPLVILR